MGLYRDHILPWLLDVGSNSSRLREPRERLLAQARGRVIEIGFGAGRSLEFYRFGPGGVERVVGIEPSAGMVRRGAARVGAAPVPVEVVDASAEAIPAPDASFDTAVTVLALCSFEDLQRGLGEVRRVLKKDGRFLFLEHGLAERPAIVRWQRRLTPIQRRLVGCRLDVAVEDEVTRAGFHLEHLERFSIPPSNPLAQMYVGWACRGDNGKGQRS